MELTTATSLAQAEADMTLLETIGQATYYELRLVVKKEGGRTALVGKAADWPLIWRDAKLALANTLLAASEAHVAELIATKEAQERELAMLRQQLGAPPVPPAVAAAATGAEVETNAAIPCPECAKPCQNDRALRMHRWRKHDVPMRQEAAEQEVEQEVEPAAVIAPELDTPSTADTSSAPAGEPELHTAPLRVPVIKTRAVPTDTPPPAIVVESPFRCERCTAARRPTVSTRSVRNPTLCIHCNAEVEAECANGKLELAA